MAVKLGTKQKTVLLEKVQQSHFGQHVVSYVLSRKNDKPGRSWLPNIHLYHYFWLLPILAYGLVYGLITHAIGK